MRRTRSPRMVVNGTRVVSHYNNATSRCAIFLCPIVAVRRHFKRRALSVRGTSISCNGCTFIEMGRCAERRFPISRQQIIKSRSSTYATLSGRFSGVQPSNADLISGRSSGAVRVSAGSVWVLLRMPGRYSDNMRPISRGSMTPNSPADVGMPE